MSVQGQAPVLLSSQLFPTLQGPPVCIVGVKKLPEDRQQLKLTAHGHQSSKAQSMRDAITARMRQKAF